jgi:hypothetical protein
VSAIRIRNPYQGTPSGVPPVAPLTRAPIRRNYHTSLRLRAASPYRMASCLPPPPAPFLDREGPQAENAWVLYSPGQHTKLATPCFWRTLKGVPMKLPRLACLLTILLSTVVLAQSNPVPFINQPLVPAAIAPGGPDFTLTVNGTGFVSGSTVNWNGIPLATTFISSSQLTAVVPASDVSGVGTASVTVNNPGPGGGNSNVAFLLITNPNSSLAFNMANVSAGNAPERLVTADFNGDGILDVATADEIGNTITILLGNGDGTFQPAITYPAAGKPFSIAVGDFDADGKIDLAVTNFCCPGATVSILLGNGDGTFQPQVQYATGKEPDAVIVGDLNGDGKLDLAMVADTDSAVSILIGNGDGTFQPYVEYPAGAGANGVTTGDFNGDGVLDLAVTTSASGTDQEPVSILLGRGDGSFQSPTFYTTAVGYLNALETADLNGDGKLDLIVTGIGYGGESGGVSVLLGNGDGTFQTHVDYLLNTAVDSVAVGDFNGDGIPDLAATHINPSGQISILLGNGDGSFGTAMNFPTGYDPAGILAADFNGDGRLDVITGNRDTTISVLLQSPVPSFSPSNLSFGNQNVGTSSAPQNVTLTNTGSATLKISSIAVTGANSGDFSQQSNCGSSLSAGANCTITVTFTPTAPGSRSASVSVSDNAPGSPQSIPLSGTGVGAVVMLSPTSLNFGNQTVGIPSSPQSVMLTNTGNSNLTIASIQITGQNANEFSEVTNCPSSLSPNNSCQIKVTFLPTTTGTQNGSLGVSDNAPGSPQQVPLTGVGVLPAVTFSPPSLTFATQVVFTTSPAQKVTLTNTGLGILKITAGKISGEFGGTTSCGKTLAPGANCTINVTFKPRTKGPLNGDISVTDNAPGSPQTVPLAGTGTYVQLSPTSLNFGNQPVNTTSPPKYITLTNKGSGTVNFTGSGITITGANAGDFAEANNCGSSVPSGGNCRIKVTFTPTQQGKRTADVSVIDDGGGSPQTVPLAGTGTP